MSTKMDDDDWKHTLAVFRACLPRRGGKAEDDRRFLEALHFFTVENIRRRALPERFGPWNSVWKRFDRLSKAGVFEAFFDTLAAMSFSLHLIEMFYFTIVRAHVSPAEQGAREGKRSVARAAASPRKSTQNRTPPCAFIAFDLTGGEAFDGRHFETLLGIGPDIKPRVVICDKKATPATPTARPARERGIAPVIPHKANEKNKPAFFARVLYKARGRIEQGVWTAQAL